MSDKSPRQGMSKKSDRSIEEERADKRDEATGAATSPADQTNGTKN